MEKIKVAFFAEILIEDFDGASRTMFQILKRIPKDKFEFLFVCGVGPNELFGFDCIKVPTITLPLNSTYKMALPQLSQARLKDKLSEFEPDVIHIATPSLLGQFAVNYAQKNEIPVISIYHTHFISYIDYYLKHLPFLIDFVKSKAIVSQRNFYNQCDKIYVPSKTIASGLREMGIEGWRMKLWQRGIDRKLFSPEKRDEEFIRDITGNEHPVILFVSRLVWEKNLETLVRLYDSAQRKRLKYNFVIAGDGVARAACEKQMPGAIFTGKVDHETLSKLYASSAVFLFPSISETIGNVVLEAMASGLPCVIADGGGSRDFIQQGVNGFKCEPNNEEDYIEKIRFVLESKEIHQDFKEAGLKYCQLFNWENLTDIYFNDVIRLTEQAGDAKLLMKHAV